MVNSCSNRGCDSKFRLGAVKLCRAGHGLFPPLNFLSSIYRGILLSGTSDSATFRSLWERGTAELFKPWPAWQSFTAPRRNLLPRPRFGFLWECGTAELFKLSGTCRN